MFFHVDTESELAVYDQIARQIKFSVADGAMAEGELIPSVRELAREHAINPNTVARAYRQLQDQGIVEPVRGTGLAIARGARRVCRDLRRQLLGERLSQALREALQAGLAANEVQQLVATELRKLQRKSG
jgi:GntR family transcriptional regulator